MPLTLTATIDGVDADGQPVVITGQSVDGSPHVTIWIGSQRFHVPRRDLFMASVALAGDIDDDMTAGEPTPSAGS